MAGSSKQLNVSITPHFSRFISEKVKSGRYSNASEVVREALRRFEQDEEIRAQDAVTDPDGVEALVAAGFASVESGEGVALAGEREVRTFFGEIGRRGRARLAAAAAPAASPARRKRARAAK
jgi:antitoxin ParD1/3/4